MSIHEDETLDAELEEELAAFAAEEASKLGLDTQQYVEYNNQHFTLDQRAHTTMLISGLTMAHDTLACAALRGIGYNVEQLDAADSEALQFGKEFGNRGQCNPTYFTVGNLVKHLVHLRDDKGMATADIIERYLFVTAGACGPCRFGTYVTEYRKALRDAGFDGFRVMLFQQQGGLKQATGAELGLQVNQEFCLGLVRSLIAGDVLNLLGYRLRPYEVVPGATNDALSACHRHMIGVLESKKSIVRGLTKCRKILKKVEIDRTVPKPLVSIIGEFWAMTTEGDGNYQLQWFLESEGAEVDIQPITAWLLFMVWENKWDTEQRITLRQDDDARRGLKGKDATKKLWMLALGDKAIRSTFQTYAHAAGLYGYQLPNMDTIASLAERHYDNSVRGGEGHMEVGKLIHFIEDRVNHMTISVKPFGCMPSSGVSDGVQSLVQSQYPEAIFLPIETTGDGKVNVYSRIQMMMFKARKRAAGELDTALEACGLDAPTFKARVGRSRYRRSLRRPPHHSAGVAANLAYAVGGYSPKRSAP